MVMSQERSNAISLKTASMLKIANLWFIRWDYLKEVICESLTNPTAQLERLCISVNIKGLFSVSAESLLKETK